MSTAFVLAGGGSIGAVQVGMLRELLAHGIKPDSWSARRSERSTARISPAPPAWKACAGSRPSGAAFGAATCFRSPGAACCVRLRAGAPSWIPAACASSEAHLPYRELEHAALPLHVVATDILGGALVKLSSGPAVDAVLASCAIPGAFPPVRVGEHHLVDGAVASNTPIRVALELGATRMIVLPSGYACALDAPPRGAVATVLHAITLMIAHQLVVDLERCGGQAEIVTVPPLCPLAVSPYDFSRADELIDRSAEQTRRWLQRGGLEKRRIPGALRPHED